MNKENFIPIKLLCTHYQVDLSFFTNLNEYGLIEIHRMEHSEYIPAEQITEVEKMIRVYQDLHLNMEGIDVVWNLLQKIDNLQNEIMAIRRRLQLYEG